MNQNYKQQKARNSKNATTFGVSSFRSGSFTILGIVIQLGEVFGYLGEVCNFAASILKFVTFISPVCNYNKRSSKLQNNTSEVARVRRGANFAWYYAN
jgi:hypothetical protein